MKKILMLVTMIMMLAVSAVCSASNGKVLDELSLTNLSTAASTRQLPP